MLAARYCWLLSAHLISSHPVFGVWISSGLFKGGQSYHVLVLSNWSVTNDWFESRRRQGINVERYKAKKEGRRRYFSLLLFPLFLYIWFYPSFIYVFLLCCVLLLSLSDLSSVVITDKIISCWIGKSKQTIVENSKVSDWVQ